MKVLLDECLPRKLKNSLTGHDCQTVLEAGFAAMKNGELLSLAEKTGSRYSSPSTAALSSNRISGIEKSQSCSYAVKLAG